MAATSPTSAVRSNVPLLYHRQVTITDVYFARILLEFMAFTTSFVAMAILLYAMGWVAAPEDALGVLGGWLLLGWFGAGLGLVIGALSERFQVVQNLWPPVSYILMPFSGVAFVADALPHRMREIALWLPMLNAVEFLREGWFGSQIKAHYDIAYVVVFNLVLTAIGLSLVRRVGLESSDE